MFKTIFIIMLLVTAISIGGGSYYYFEMYQPRAYSVSVLSLYQKLENAGLQPDTSSLKGATDYESALKVLDDRIGMLTSIKREVSGIKAPRRMVNFHEEFRGHIDFMLSQHEHAGRLGVVVKNANDVQRTIVALQSNESSPIQEKNAVVGDFQKMLGERVSHIQTSAKVFFSEEEKEPIKPSFSELKSLWDGASPGFDLVLRKLHALNPRLPISQVNNMFTSFEQKQLEGYNRKIEEFSKAIEDVVKQYSAYDLVAFRYYPNSTPTEASERALRFYQIMQDLKQKL